MLFFFSCKSKYNKDNSILKICKYYKDYDFFATKVVSMIGEVVLEFPFVGVYQTDSILLL